MKQSTPRRRIRFELGKRSLPVWKAIRCWKVDAGCVQTGSWAGGEWFCYHPIATHGEIEGPELLNGNGDLEQPSLGLTGE